MKKTVSLIRAVAAVCMGCSVTAISMYNLSKSLLLSQSQAYKREITALKAQLSEKNEEG